MVRRTLRLYPSAVRFHIWSSIKIFTFLLLGFREPHQYYYRISGNRMNSRVVIGRVRTLLHPKMYGTPFIRLSFFFRSSFQFHVGVHFSLVGPLLLPRLHILPRKMLQQESSGGAVRKCFEPFCAYTLQSRTQFQFATTAPLHPSQILPDFLLSPYLCLHLRHLVQPHLHRPSTLKAVVASISQI